MRSLRVLAAARLLSALAVVLAASACAGGEPDESAVQSDPEAPALTREEIERQAEAMSPAMAESLGIVDTTIRIEPPVPAESIILLEPQPDSEAPQ